MAISTHPADARYFRSRAEARKAAGKAQRVVRLGTFAGGSFGVYPPQRGNGLYVGQVPGGPTPLVCVWMVTARK